MNQWELPAHELTARIRTGRITCLEVMSSLLDRIAAIDDQVHAYITVLPTEQLLEEARRMDLRIRDGDELGALGGLPIAVKDNISTADVVTTCGSRMLQDYRPPYDATVIERIRESDGILIGKTNMDEFAMGSSTEHSHFFPTRNPRSFRHVPGGTSGGSAAAVAAHEAVMAIGSDTGGSIRQPASFCGVVGMKPTYGRVSRFGLIAYASSFDQIGVLTKDVTDAATLLTVIAGPDDRDSTTVRTPTPDYAEGLTNIAKQRIGVPKEYFGPGLDPQVCASIQETLSALADSGHELVEVSLPHSEYSVAAYYIIACSEASSNLARFDGCKYGYAAPNPKSLQDLYQRTRGQGFGDEVQRRIILGTYALSSGYYEAYYLKAQKVRRLIANDFTQTFAACDVIAHPVAPTPAFQIGEKLDDALSMYLADIYSVGANIAGLPAISVPVNPTKEGLPIGIQLVGPPLSEASLLKLGYLIERNAPAIGGSDGIAELE